MNQPSLHRTVDLKSAVFILIGFVVGATIFVLPGTLAADAGPAVFLAYLFAGIPAIFTCFVMAQVGGAFPTSGASYTMINKVLSPYWGFVYLWLMVSLAAVVIPLVALGFSDYLQHFLPGLNTTLTSVLVIVFFITLNCLGMDLAVKVQAALVLCFLTALTVFGVSGVTQGDVELVQPLFPNGFSPVVLAAITAYFSYAGVFVIAEIAGEVKNPGKTIPRAILISFVVILFVYALVPIALVMTLPWMDYAETNMAVVTAAQVLLPSWVVNFIGIGALLAAATSINGILMGISRDFLKGAEVNLFPQYFARINSRNGTPVRAVLVVGVVSLSGVAVGGSIGEYAQVAVLGLMVTQIITGVAVLKLPKVLPLVYEAAHFKLPKRQLHFYSWGFILFSIAFFLYLGLDSPKAIVAVLVSLMIGSIFYKKRSEIVEFTL
jgi:APA family basic amino acid/polyamine antiporter